MKLLTMVSMCYGWRLVDMGGRVKWASCNWDASSPEQTGVLCGWGDPTGTVKYQGLLILMTFMCLLPDVMSIMPGESSEGDKRYGVGHCLREIARPLAHAHAERNG